MKRLMFTVMAVGLLTACGSCSICIKTSRFSVDFGQKGNELRSFFEILAKNSCYIMN